MKDRQKILMIALVVAVLFWQGKSVVMGIFLDPIRERQNRIDNLQKSITKKKEEKWELNQAISELQSWNLRSLPPDRIRAAEKYQSWLIDLGTKVGLTNVSVAPPIPELRLKDDTYYGITAMVKGQGTLATLCDFLHDFHQSGLLHRVLMVKATTTKHEGNPVLDLTINVEALSMKDSPARTTLMAKTDKPLVPDKPLKARAEYLAMTKKNPFIQTYDGPPRPRDTARNNDRRPTETPKDPPFDAAEHTYLISYFASGDVREIWLYDRSNNQRTILSEDGEFEIGSVKGKVVLIAEDYIHVQRDGELWELAFGRNLRDMSKLPNSGKSDKKPSESK